MVKLFEQDIRTKEVLDWEGLHLLHFSGSTCSQKIRIFLSLKGIAWESHPVDLVKQENYSPWFLGINPRGLVPVLIHDGDVHIESNDILSYLEDVFPSPPLILGAMRDVIVGRLKEEDDLHLDIRTITMRYVLPAFLAKKKPASLDNYQKDSGTVEGTADPHKQSELDFWRHFASNGVDDKQIQSATARLHHTYSDFEEQLENTSYLLGPEITLLDIAWFIYTHRLYAAGYPFSRLHPQVNRWYLGLLARDEFAREVVMPTPLKIITGVLHAIQRLRGTSLQTVANL